MAVIKSYKGNKEMNKDLIILTAIKKIEEERDLNYLNDLSYELQSEVINSLRERSRLRIQQMIKDGELESEDRIIQ